MKTLIFVIILILSDVMTVRVIHFACSLAWSLDTAS